MEEKLKNLLEMILSNRYETEVHIELKKGTKNSITVKNSSALNAPVAFTKVTDIMVEGANSFDETAYDLWYANFDNATTGSAALIITWA